MSTSLSGTSGLPRVSPTNAANSLTSAVTGTGAQTTGLDASRKTIAQNFDAFLTLLTTQLRNQSPLDPLDANQFTQQLVQFSGVEQQLRSNDLLTAISKNVGGGSADSGKLNAATAASLIGVQVSVDGSSASLSSNGLGGNSATFPVNIPDSATNLEVQIRNATGQEIYRGPWAPPGRGNQTYVWNGVGSNGVPAPADQKYTFSVVAENSAGQKGLLSTDRTGTVTSVDLSGPEATVQFGGLSIPLSQIKRVALPGS